MSGHIKFHVNEKGTYGFVYIWIFCMFDLCQEQLKYLVLLFFVICGKVHRPGLGKGLYFRSYINEHIKWV